MPKISVLMGAYNCQNTIERAIESIQKQSYTDWELLICDDGSTDQTRIVVENYKQKDDRIHLLVNESNCGLSYTLNRCLVEARGEYCARMDGDDLCDPSRFEKQLRFLESNPRYGFVSTTMKRFDENGVYQCPEPGGIWEPTKFDYVKSSPFCHAPSMFRTESYKAVGGYRDLHKTRGMEDYDLWFRLYAKGIRGCVMQEPLYSMYDGQAAASRRTYRRRVNEAMVRLEGYRMIHVPFYLYLFALKPLIIGLLPNWLYKRIRFLRR